ncbi:MAG: FecR domain-containing protein [Syntrophales bacterium]|nr:FecR domain-containing protein [Syntrophales bacterium]
MINKKRFKIVGLMVICLLFTAVSSFAQTVGRITYIEGNVDITKPGKAAVPVRLGDGVDIGDIIRTKLKSKCEVTFTDGNVLRLAENTRIRVTEYTMGKDGTLNLFRGKIHSIVSATGVVKGSRYEVHTPTAIAGVRGTNFFTYFQAGVTGVIFKEGQGYGYSLNRPEEVVTIKAGQTMIVVDPSQPPVLRAATPQEIEKHTQDTAPAEKKKEEAKKEEKKEEAPSVKREQAKEEPKKEEAPPTTAELTPAPAPETPATETKTVTAVQKTTPPPTQPLVPVKQDTTPPEITIVSTQAEPTTGYRLSNVDVSLSSNEDATYYYRIDGSDWTETPKNFTLSNLSEGDHTLEVRGKDAAGNTSSPKTRSFHLSRYDLSGMFVMSGSNVQNGDATGKVAGVSNDNWGGWGIKMGGYGNYPTDSWKIQAGGQSYETTATNEDGYWIETVDGTTDYNTKKLKGTSDFTYLSKDRRGYGTGKTEGFYEEAGSVYRYQLNDSGKGKYTEIPLVFSGLVDAKYHYFDDESSEVTPDGGSKSIVGSTASPFESATETNVSGNDVDLYVMGKSDSYHPATWWGRVSGSYVGSTKLPDGFVASRTYEDFMEGMLLSLYVDGSGKAGILEGKFEGSNYTGISMFKSTTGSIKATLKDTGYTSQTTEKNYIEGTYYGDFLPNAYYIQDVAQGYLGAYTVRLIKDSKPAAWGIFNMELGGKFTKDPTNNWRLEAGGTSWLGNEDTEYWVSRINGSQWSYDETKGYRIVGEFSGGRYITEKSLGVIKGKLLGSYEIGDGFGSWVAVGMGTFERTHDLTKAPNFSSVLEEGNLAAVVPGDFYVGMYKKHYSPEGMPYEHHTLEYEYGYFKDGQGNTKKGFRSEYKETLKNGEEVEEEWHYYHNQTYVKWNYDAERFVEKGDAPSNLDLSTEPPTSNNFPGGEEAGYYSVHKQSFPTNSVQQVAKLDGVMGGLGNLWTASKDQKKGNDVNIAIIGEYSSDIGLPVIYGSIIQSKRYLEGGISYTTPDGGAYYGWLGGVVDAHSADNMEGKLYGLYIAPNGSAGYLKGSVSGRIYTGIRMWEVDGTIHPEYVKETTGIEAKDFLNPSKDNLVKGAIEAQMSFGSFENTGWIGKMAMGWGESRSIKGQDWGIFYVIHGVDNFYENPQNKKNFTVQTAGVGEFGAFQDKSGSFVPDYGYWAVQVKGIVDLEAGKIFGELSEGETAGKFLTYTKAGMISDWRMLGTITPDEGNSTKGRWQAISVGTWEADQSLSFSSGIGGKTLPEVRERKRGYVNYNAGYSSFSYAYDINREKPEGYVSNQKYVGPGAHERTWKDYHYSGVNDTPIIEVWTKAADKPEGQATYSYGGTYTKDNIDDKIYQDMYSFTGKTAPDEEYQEHYFPDRGGDFRGIMGGYGTSLWSSMKDNPTNLVFLGLYDNEEHRKRIIFNGEIVSFDPKVTFDAYSNSTSPVGGAYYGFFGGLIDENVRDVNGAVYTLYVDDGAKGSTQRAGILKGSFSGNVYPRTVEAFEQGGIWDAEGSIYKIVMKEGTNLEPSQFNPGDLITKDKEYYSEHFIFNHEERYSTLSDFSTSAYASIVMSAFIKGDYCWGIVQNIEAGTYTGTPSGKVELARSVDWKNNQGGLKITTSTYSDTDWNVNKERISGTFTGSVTQWEEAKVYMMGGDIHGMFNPSIKTYEMAITGGVVTVDKFMELVGSETGRENLKSLNIPTVFVGKDTLSGNYGDLTVNMNNVSFYAYSTGQSPRIWATNDVNGTFTQAPQTGTIVPLQGSVLEAQFNIQKWDGSKWGAKVMGQTQSGKNLGGYEIKFTGGAAGTINQQAGTFSGTAAGISVPKSGSSGQ